MTMFAQRYGRQESVCGLYYHVPCFGGTQRAFLPQVEVHVHANVLATTSRTVLKQIFANPSTTRGIREVRYAFPLYDGVSVVGFSCQVGDRTIVGEVKEKEKAKEVFRDALARGETAGLLEQLPEASDVFTTTISNIPPSARVTINITYLGELKHDMEVDGIRYTIPTSICPRYGGVSGVHSDSIQQIDGTISIIVDTELAEGSFIQRLQSPTHPIAMSMGTTSIDPDAAPTMSKASATLTLGTAQLETDFVLQIISRDTSIPKALLETHPTIPDHRALMATLVPKFTLPAEKPEIVFVCDQSGSMGGSPIKLAVEALQVFLKSLPVGVKFNICSFGNHHSFLWPRSATYNQDNLDHAVRHAAGLQASYGGTEILQPLRATIENRYTDMPLEIILLTDGEIWNQQLVFDYLNEQIQEHKAPVRVFTLGIGNGVSHAMIEGIAKAGNGFSQSVGGGEKMGTKVVRMLKGALSPHVNDYTLEVKYSASEEEDDFEIVEKVADSLKVKLDLEDKNDIRRTEELKKPISLFDTSTNLDGPTLPAKTASNEDRYAHLAAIPAPRVLQAPQEIPSLFAFNRTTVYLLLGPSAPRTTPTSVILRGTSAHGPLELEIPIQILDTPGETIHQLAAKKAISELEQGRGWLPCARDASGQLLKTRFDGRFSDMVEREAVRLGVQFQVGGKWCSFVATEQTSKTKDDVSGGKDWEYLEDEQLEASGALFPGFSEDRARNFQMQQFQQRQQAAQNQAMQRAQQPQYARQGATSFGSSANLTQAPPAPSRGGLFGGRTTGQALNYQAMQQQQQQQQSLQHNPPSGLFGSTSSGAQWSAPQMFAPSSGQASGSPAFGSKSLFTSAPAAGASFGTLSGNAAPTPAPPANPFGSAAATASPSATLFGNAAPPAPASSSSFGTSTVAAAAPSSSLFGTPSSSHALQDYQMRHMLLEQQNKKRLRMVRQPPAQQSVSHPTNDEIVDLGDDAATTDVHVDAVQSSPRPRPSSVQKKKKTSHEVSGKTASPRKSEPEILTQLISHQSFNGCFLFNSSLLHTLGIALTAFEEHLSTLSSRYAGVGRDELFTAAVVLYMEKHMQGLRGEWELLGEKARGWLGEVCGDVDKVLEEVEGLIADLLKG